MSNEKIYNRRCFIRRSDHRVYCGKCGKMVMQDEYNLKKHAKQCGFKPYDLIKIFRENEDFTYGMREEEKTMNYYVFTPRMVLRPGFQDRYIHGTWTRVYAASFSKTEKKMTEEGLKNFHYWISQKMDSMNEAPDYEVVRKSFGILEHENLEMFSEIYHGKGYRYRQLMPPEEARALLAGNLFECDSERFQEYAKRDAFFSICGNVIPYGEELVLRVKILAARKEEIQLLISRDYSFVEGNVNLRYLLRVGIENQILTEELKEFDKRYPEFRLMDYLMKGGRNLLIPLVAGNFDRGLELAVKAGCISMADSYFQMKEAVKGVAWDAKNLREMFGMPVKILRKLTADSVRIEEWPEILPEVYRTQPDILNDVKRINANLVLFLKGNIFWKKYGRQPDIKAVKAWSTHQKKKVMRYLSQCEQEYMVYVDYMRMSEKIGYYVEGITPENIYHAHVEALYRYRDGLNAREEEFFRRRIREEEYISRSTEYGEEAAWFEGEDYLVRIPELPQDLIWESEELHHCVRTYVDRVIEGRTQICFLRRREAPDIPFVTMEIVDSVLIQVKAKFNTKAPADAQNFIRKWAERKNIRINTSDMLVG